MYNSYMDNLGRIEQLTDKLIRANETYEVYLNASPWGIIVVDGLFNILFMNSKMEEMSGYTLQELIGGPLSVLMPRSDRKTHARIEAEYRKKPHARTGNHGLHPRILSKSGEISDVEISISPSKVNDNVVFFASVRKIETLFDTVEGRVRDA